MPRTRPRPSVLTLSGSDPSGGAGLEADLKVFHAHGVFGMAIPTLLTVQNARELRKVRFLDPDFMEQQWRAVFDGERPAAIKVGALGTRRMVLKLAALLARPEAKGIPVVLDPVLSASAGGTLLEKSALPALKALLPLCRLVTPNVAEFGILSGRPLQGDPRVALEAYAKGRNYAVLLKGGHIKGKDCPDHLWDKRLFRIPGRRLQKSAHGTGCALASAIAANLALGKSLAKSCQSAKAFVGRALAGSDGRLDF